MFYNRHILNDALYSVHLARTIQGTLSNVFLGSATTNSDFGVYLEPLPKTMTATVHDSIWNQLARIGYNINKL